ncbi:MAG TPA: LysM peptidoglycan-binding domain-containing protein [Bacillota bacterium]|nr:LysM peptidoglycan-binding domain-containing protein [Bacillota bacterium]
MDEKIQSDCCQWINQPEMGTRQGGRVPVSCLPGFQGRYTVQPGDTMFFIAQRFGVSLNALIAANPHITNPALIFPGDVLCVPGATQPGCRVPASCPPGFQGRYTVQPGDTMFFIAQRFGVSLNALIAANPHITNPALIFPCDVLCVPGAPPPPQCRVPASCPPGFQGRYTVQPGDTMFLIAQRFGVSLDALIAANPQIPDPNVIFPCDVLCVPGTQPPPQCRVPASCPPGFQGRYTVQPGDTMFLIAQRFGVSLDALIAANPQIPDPNVIFPCDVLCVPESQPPCRIPASCPPGFQGRYTVQPGDTMFFIAQRFGVSLNALIAANPHITNPAIIFPCDVLCVPGPMPPPPPCRIPASCPPGFQGRYTVQPGDTMFFIAQRFGVSLDALIAANPHITNPNLIFPCDVLCVPETDEVVLTGEEDEEE